MTARCRSRYVFSSVNARSFCARPSISASFILRRSLLFSSNRRLSFSPLRPIFLTPYDGWGSVQILWGVHPKRPERPFIFFPPHCSRYQECFEMLRKNCEKRTISRNPVKATRTGRMRSSLPCFKCWRTFPQNSSSGRREEVNESEKTSRFFNHN